MVPYLLHFDCAFNDCLHTVGTESIRTPLNFSLFVSLQPFAKIKKVPDDE